MDMMLAVDMTAAHIIYMDIMYPHAGPTYYVSQDISVGGTPHRNYARFSHTGRMGHSHTAPKPHGPLIGMYIYIVGPKSLGKERAGTRAII